MNFVRCRGFGVCHLVGNNSEVRLLFVWTCFNFWIHENSSTSNRILCGKDFKHGVVQSSLTYIFSSATATSTCWLINIIGWFHFGLHKRWDFYTMVSLLISVWPNFKRLASKILQNKVKVKVFGITCNIKKYRLKSNSRDEIHQSIKHWTWIIIILYLSNIEMNMQSNLWTCEPRMCWNESY